MTYSQLDIVTNFKSGLGVAQGHWKPTFGVT